MAFVVRRPQGRFEIRESHHTRAGPRARSLATFRILDADALSRAAAAAVAGLDEAAVIESARRVGAPVAEPAADAAARTLIGELRAGRELSPGLRALLVDALAGRDGESIGDWVDRGDEDRAAALRDLLDLGDRLPRPRRTTLNYPRLAPVRGTRDG